MWQCENMSAIEREREMREIIFRNFSDLNIYQFIVWFFIYSFLGWCMECVVIRVQLGYWENRGFAKLPFCVIYGFGCLGIYTVCTICGQSACTFFCRLCRWNSF